MSRVLVRRLVGACISYVILLCLVVLLLPVVPESPLRMLLALLPIIPVVVGLWTFVHVLDGMDELQRHIQLRALTFASGTTALVTLTYGLLETLSGFPHLPLLWVFPLMMALWGVGLALTAQRYR